MAELFFQYEKTSYLFNTKYLKLFQISNEGLIEINEPKALQNVRFNSVEIDKEQALILARNFNK